MPNYIKAKAMALNVENNNVKLWGLFLIIPLMALLVPTVNYYGALIEGLENNPAEVMIMVAAVMLPFIFETASKSMKSVRFTLTCSIISVMLCFAALVELYQIPNMSAKDTIQFLLGLMLAVAFLLTTFQLYGRVQGQIMNPKNKQTD